MKEESTPAPTPTPTVPEMLRETGTNTQEFMLQVAQHIETLEKEIARLREIIAIRAGK